MSFDDVSQVDTRVAGGVRHRAMDRRPRGQVLAERDQPEPGVWTKTAQDPEFNRLRRRFRRFVFPVTGLFVAWYLTYVVLLYYAPEFMGRMVLGNFTPALLLGLLQFASTFAITIGYVMYANRRLDPVADQIRERIEGADR